MSLASLEAGTPEQNARAREFMDLREESLSRKVTLDEMLAWVEQKDAWQTANNDQNRQVSGAFHPSWIRDTAVSWRLIDFLTLCILYKDDIATLFRAKAHQQRRRG